MSTLKMIGTGIGAVVGLAITIFIVVFLFRIKGQLDAAQTAKDTADVVRLTGELTDAKASLALRDSIALQASKTFILARDTRQPVVTGGGAAADAIANAAVTACYAIATNALTKCQQARLTADSVPILQDSISTLEKRLLRPKRWTAYGGLYYAYPDRSALARVEMQFRVFNLFSANAGVEHAFTKTLPDSLKTRYYIGGNIPFR